LYELIKDAERVTEITTYRFPTNVRRHYERLAAFPVGLLVLGDAIASFNPLYGQGMSSAALQVQVLQDLLNERAQEKAPLRGLASTFFAKAAEVVDGPWTLAANADFAYPKTRGVRPPDPAESTRYFMALEGLCADDMEVHVLLTEVFNLVKPLSVLSEEPLRSRVLAQLQKHQA